MLAYLRMHHVRIKNKAMYLHKNWQNLKGPIMGPLRFVCWFVVEGAGVDLCLHSYFPPYYKIRQRWLSTPSRIISTLKRIVRSAVAERTVEIALLGTHPAPISYEIGAGLAHKTKQGYIIS